MAQGENFEEWLENKNNPKPKEKKRHELKRTRLKPVSSKQRKRLSSYKRAVEDHLSKDSNRYCAICGTNDGLTIHHISGRGSNIDNDLITLCVTSYYLSERMPELNRKQGCHGFVHANPKWARENGYLK